MYGKLFNSRLAEQEVTFSDFVMDITDGNKHLVVPMLLGLAQTDAQKSKLEEICQQLKFDIAAVEAGVSPDPDNSILN